MGPEISRFCYRLIGGRRGKTLSWGIAYHKERNVYTRALYGLAPRHFDASLEVNMSTYEPGPLRESDGVSEFQENHDLQVDGKVGHQTWNTLYDLWEACLSRMRELEAEVNELTADLMECCPPDSPGPVHPTPDAGDKWMLIFIGAVVGFTVAALFFSQVPDAKF